MTPAIMVYVTAGDRDEALMISRAVVNERLAACANIFPEITAVYRWEGAVSEATEVVIILKTTDVQLAELTARIKELHSYDCPCVAAISIEGGNPDFIDWITQQTN